MSTINHEHNKELLRLFYNVYLFEEDCEDTHTISVSKVNDYINKKKDFAPFHITDHGRLLQFYKEDFYLTKLNKEHFRNTQLTHKLSTVLKLIPLFYIVGIIISINFYVLTLLSLFLVTGLVLALVRAEKELDDNQLLSFSIPHELVLASDIISHYEGDVQRDIFLEAVWDWRTSGAEEAHKAIIVTINKTMKSINTEIENQNIASDNCKEIINSKWSVHNELNSQDFL